MLIVLDTFGGLWKVVVHSVERIVVRIMGEHSYALEEFCTTLYHIEAILRSRPLVPLSSDPTECNCLTPGNFLIGHPLLLLPGKDIPVSSRPHVHWWKLINQSAQFFMHRWRDEYLKTLQICSRCTADAPNIAVNDMAVIKDPNLPPLKWHIAGIQEVLTGTNGVVRVVCLRTATWIFTRPMVKIVKLPT